MIHSQLTLPAHPHVAALILASCSLACVCYTPLSYDSENFFDSEIPAYAILSHRWGDDEVSYQDFLAGKKKGGAGYAKILACCNYAAADTTTYRSHRLLRGRFERVWSDTCCI